MENKTAKMDMTNPNSNDEFEQRRKQVDLSMKIHSYRRSDTDTITIEQLLLNMQVS